MPGPLFGLIRMATCRNHTRRRHPTPCAITAWRTVPTCRRNPNMTARSTRRTTATTRIAAVGAIAVAGTMLLTACGDQTKNNDSGSTKASTGASAGTASPADLLPADIKSKGVIRVGSDIAYPPVEFKDKSGKTAGIDPDLGEALGKVLGVEFK